MGSDLDYQVEIFANRLKKRSKHLGKWARRNGVSCYRLYDRDIPEVPLVVDLYEDYVHVAEYHAPHKELPGPPEIYADRMLDAARRSLGVRPERAFYKTRRKTGRGEQYEKLSDESVTDVVHEGGLRFRVNFSDYLDTGLFLDHRLTRAIVRDVAAEMRERGAVRMLNLFSYTGSFTVYAADGGATETVSVDLSNTYTSWAKENLELNGFTGPAHRFEVDDVFAFLGRERERGATYDLIVLDPPTFSNSKKMDRILDIQRDHGELLGRCAQILSRSGVLVFSTNKRRFRLTDAPSSLTITDITAQTIPEDFRNARIHQAYLAERSSS
ncbi:MAG: class I SAM-dependent methyltransferase [Spirochaetota bacterium]